MHTLSGEALVNAARDIARAAHDGATDKAGKPYIGHPARVAARLDGHESKAAGWLHDVLEDTPLTTDELRAKGFPTPVIEAVVAVTHFPGEPHDRYYARIRAAGELALRVKLADIADNADPARLALLDAPTRHRLQDKYEHARVALSS